MAKFRMELPLCQASNYLRHDFWKWALRKGPVLLESLKGPPLSFNHMEMAVSYSIGAFKQRMRDKHN